MATPLPEWNGVSSAMVQLAGKNEPWVIKCKLCNGVTLESRTTWQQHFDSKRHRNAARQQGLSPQGFRFDNAVANAANAAAAAAAAEANKAGGATTPAAGTGGAAVPRSNAAVPPAAPGGKQLAGKSPTAPGGGAAFDIAKSIASQVAGRGGRGGAAPPPPSAATAPNGKTIMPRPGGAAAPVGPGGAKNAAAAPRQSAWAVPPPVAPQAKSTTTSPVTNTGGKYQQQQQSATSTPGATAAGGASPLASRQESSVILGDNVVNRDRITGAGAAGPGGASQAGGGATTTAVRVSVGAPLVDPDLDRTKPRTLAFVAAGARVVRVETSVAASPGALEQFNVSTRLPTSLFRLLEPRPSDVDSSAQAGAAATETVKALREAYAELRSELGGVDSEADGPGMTRLVGNKPVGIATARLAESFFNAAVCFAPYDDPGPAALGAASAVASTARVDTASFWS